MAKTINKTTFSWALYDWANSAYATVILAGFFPLFFKQYWSDTTDVSASTFQLGLTNSIASTIIVILAPVLGAIADAGNLKKRLLYIFALLGILMSGSLYFVGQGETLLALTLFCLSAIGFSGSIIFYDSLLTDICEEKSYNKISSLGYALGYLGGGVLFAFDVYMTLNPELFGFKDSTEAVQFSFLTVSVWWFIFSLPLFFNVNVKNTKSNVKISQAIVSGVEQLKITFRKIKKLPMVLLFLVAYWLYIDGVDTIVRMAVDYGMSLGFNSSDLITALLITQFVGFPAAIAFGYLANYIGTKQGILLAIIVYFLMTLWAAQITAIAEFYVLAIIIGLVQGGVQALSRSFYARIIPKNQSAEFFGFYNMLGKFAAVLGPVMIGVVSVLTQSPRISILSISVLFIAGGVLLYYVDEGKAKRMLADYNKSGRNI
ncbi:MAG: MFS transporter [Gammaproteobacteria bacterium]|nr:MFS transporter [Gammaproteobacteria bacterium]